MKIIFENFAKFICTLLIIAALIIFILGNPQVASTLGTIAFIIFLYDYYL